MNYRIRAILCFVIFLTPLLLLTSCLSQKVGKDQPGVTIVYPPPPDISRIQYLTSISSSLKISGKQSGFNRFLFGEADAINIIKPYGISSKGSKLYICDTGIGGLVIIDLNEGSFKQFIPEGKGRLQLPLNCAVDSNESLYIADGNRRQVVVFDKDGSYLTALGDTDDSFKPTGVAVTEKNLYVTSISNHTIYIYNKEDYSLLARIPEAKPGEDGYLYQPSNVACSEGEIYITDVGDNRINVYGVDNQYIRSIGGYGNSFGQFMRPKGLALDKDLNTYVVDAAFENIQIFNSSGELLMYFGGPYKSSGDMWLPADVAIDYENNQYFAKYVDPEFTLLYLIYVTNQFGPDKIGVYGFVKPK